MEDDPGKSGQYPARDVDALARSQRKVLLLLAFGIALVSIGVFGLSLAARKVDNAVSLGSAAISLLGGWLGAVAAWRLSRRKA